MPSSRHAPGALFVFWLAFYLLTASGRIAPGEPDRFSAPSFWKSCYALLHTFDVDWSASSERY